MARNYSNILGVLLFILLFNSLSSFLSTISPSFPKGKSFICTVEGYKWINYNSKQSTPTNKNCSICYFCDAFESLSSVDYAFRFEAGIQSIFLGPTNLSIRSKGYSLSNIRSPPLFIHNA